MIINFIIDLLLSKSKKYVYNSILVIINRFIKIIKYLLINKKFNII